MSWYRTSCPARRNPSSHCNTYIACPPRGDPHHARLAPLTIILGMPAPRDSSTYPLSSGRRQHVREDLSRIEKLVGNFPRSPTMALVVAADRVDRVGCLLDTLKGQQSSISKERAIQTSVLHDDRAASGQVTGAPIAEPTGSKCGVDGLRATDLSVAFCYE